MALPWASVIVTIVLLKEASTCATPEEMFFRSFLRGARPALGSRAMLLRHLLLAGDRHRLPLAGTGIGVGPLATHRQATAMPQAAVAGHVHQPLDVHRHFAAQVALDPVLAVDQLADPEDLLIRQLVDPAFLRDVQRLADIDRVLRADAVDIAQRDRHPLVRGNVHTGDARHCSAPGALGPCFRPTGTRPEGRPDETMNPAAPLTGSRSVRTQFTGQPGCCVAALGWPAFK